MIEIIKTHISEILLAISGLGAWFFERKKRKQELADSEVKHQQHVVDLYQEVLDDLKKRYDEKFLELQGEIKCLRENLDIWKEKYRSLKVEFDRYRVKHERSKGSK